MLIKKQTKRKTIFALQKKTNPQNNYLIKICHCLTQSSQYADGVQHLGILFFKAVTKVVRYALTNSVIPSSPQLAGKASATTQHAPGLPDENFNKSQIMLKRGQKKAKPTV